MRRIKHGSSEFYAIKNKARIYQPYMIGFTYIYPHRASAMKTTASATRLEM